MSATTNSPAIPAEFQSLRDSLPPLLIIEEVAGLYRCCPASIDRWVLQKLFPAPIKIGGATKRFSRDAVLEHLANSHSREPLAARTRKASRKIEDRSPVAASIKKAAPRRKKGRAAK